MKSLHTILLTSMLFFAESNLVAMKKDMEMNPLDHASKLMNIETKHENEWWKLMSKYKTRKFDLIIKHNDEKTALKTKKIDEIKATDFSPELVTKYTKECLDLHRKHHADWRNLSKDKYDEKKALEAKQVAELDEFEKTLMAEKTPAEDK